MAVIVKPKTEDKSKVSFISKTIKDDTYLVLAGSQLYPEDEFQGLYYNQANVSNVFIEPPLDPRRLVQLTEHNNVLSQCVTAMEVNIHGTGHELEPVEKGTTADKKEVNRISEFLNEPYPGESLISIRRKIGRDEESTGWGCMEILRNYDEDLVGLRYLQSYSLRYVKLDAPVLVTRKIMRNGKEVELQYWERERRFAQKIGGTTNQFRYYREYGSTRHLNRDTGEWETSSKPVPLHLRATEILVFGLTKDSNTPYSVPRWINNLPSVLGSRKAEEFNLEFFDAGGMPPALIFIEGGMLAKDMADQLKMYLSGQAKSKIRAAVVEAQSSSGTLDSSGKVSVKVERFGQESVKDSMFREYDKAAEEHVRVAFRLPPLFLGRSTDYNFASAQVSYMLAEAQVFGPERDRFDEIFNLTIMKELKAKGVRFKSKIINMRNAESQIAGATLAKDMVDSTGFVAAINDVTGLQLEVDKKKEKAIIGKMEQDAKPPPAPKNAFGAKASSPAGLKKKVPGAPGKKKKIQAKKASDLAIELLTSEGFLETDSPYSESEKTAIQKQVDELSPEEMEQFKIIVAANVEALKQNP